MTKLATESTAKRAGTHSRNVLEPIIATGWEIGENIEQHFCHERQQHMAEHGEIEDRAVRGRFEEGDRAAMTPLAPGLGSIPPLLAQLPFQHRLADRAGGQIGHAARRAGHDHPHRPAGNGLGAERRTVQTKRRREDSGEIRVLVDTLMGDARSWAEQRLWFQRDITYPI